MVGHVSPEAYCGGNIALINNGDIITIDAIDKTLNVVCYCLLYTVELTSYMGTLVPIPLFAS